MKVAAFRAVCPFEIGDRIPMTKKTGDRTFSVTISTITDIACTHYIKKGMVEFTYEFDGNGRYVKLKEAGAEEGENH